MSAEQTTLPGVIEFLNGAARYEALEFQDYGGIVLPSRVRLSTFSRSNHETNIHFSILADLSHVSIGVARSSFIPVLSMVARVQDNRFHSDPNIAGSVGYFVDSNRWLQVSEVKTRREYRYEALRRERETVSLQAKRALIYCLLLVIVLLTGYAIIKVRKVRYL